MSNLIQQKTTSATDAQDAGTPHQQSRKKASVKGLACLLRTTEAATYVGLSPRIMEKHRTYGTGPVYRKLGNRVVYAIEDSCFGRARNPTLNIRSGSGHGLSC